MRHSASMTSNISRNPDTLELLFGGDVMLGRGIDQILPHPSDPRIFEEWIKDARGYIDLAEARSGAIPRPVAFDYVWGAALPILRAADVRIVNLETSVTQSDAAWPDKGINYRMHPENVPCLTAAGIDVATLANNHVLDWGGRGLVETLETLHAAGLVTAGAGRTAEEAEEVAVVELDARRRVLVVAAAEPESGVPFAWEARPERPGVALLRQLGEAEADAMAKRVDDARRGGDVVIASIHWGSNWGYEVEDEHVRFAHALIERGVDVVFGHSSHHPRPIEIHRGKPILYGCGDLIDDYEGISGYESFRNDLVLAYSARVSRGAIELRMKPFCLHKMRLEHASAEDASWLAGTLAACSQPYGTKIVMREDGWLAALPRRGDA
jgi:poly-gamma-glutamate capsule biosynthesis protein CapA/YwtB (metallophosphatase superfamily)